MTNCLGSCLHCRGDGTCAVKMTSTISRTNSAAISAKRSLRLSAERYSIATVRPSIQPSSRNRCTKAAFIVSNSHPCSHPGTRWSAVCSNCWARTPNGQAIAAPPTMPMNSRQLDPLIDDDDTINIRRSGHCALAFLRRNECRPCVGAKGAIAKERGSEILFAPEVLKQLAALLTDGIVLSR